MAKMALEKLSPTSLYWWQRDMTTDMDRFGLPVQGGHEDCLHRKYWMTCREYEQILRRSRNCCEHCGLPGQDNIRGRLYIDHDHGFGRWAVRGLLCGKCNTGLGKPWLTADFADYLSRSWYLAAPIPLRPIPEPPSTARVTDGNGNVWLRRNGGWYLPLPRARQPQVDRSWPWLYQEFGPRFLSIDVSMVAVDRLDDLQRDVLIGAHHGRLVRSGDGKVFHHRADRAASAEVRKVADHLLGLGLIEAGNVSDPLAWRGWERPIQPTPAGRALVAQIYANGSRNSQGAPA